MARPTAACMRLSGRLARDYNGCDSCQKAPGVPVYIDIPEPPGSLRWSPTRIQVSLASTLHCRTRQGSGLRALSMLVPIRPSWAFWIPVPTGPWSTRSDLLVPGLDFLPSYQQQLGRPAGYTPPPPPWATRACRNLGTTVGYPEIIPTTVAPGVLQDPPL